MPCRLAPHVRALLLLLLLLTARSLALNPFISHMGVADPHVHVFTSGGGGARFWLYATSDFAANDTGFLNERWWVWESPDLVSWSLASVLLPNATAATRDEWKTCWATDGAQGADGQFYWYLSLGSQEIGVMRGASPAGPWEDVLRRPLISKEQGAALGTQARDPALFVDSDGTPYLVFGTFNYFIARLEPNMTALAEPPRAVAFVGNVTSQNGVNVLDDKPFLHTRGGVYYFSFGAFYAMGSSPYGPFTQDPASPTWVVEALIAPEFRTNGTPSGPCWCQATDLNDRHGSFFSAGGQDFWSSNDRSHSDDPYNTNAFRDPILTYVHYFSNGTIAPVVIDAMGVGEYDGTARIQAENYMAAAGAAKAHRSGTSEFYVALGGGGDGGGGGGGGGRLTYPHVRHAPPRAALRLYAAGGRADCALRAQLLDAGTGAALVECSARLVQQAAWHEASCGGALEGLPGDFTVRLAWGEECEGVAVDWLQLQAV